MYALCVATSKVCRSKASERKTLNVTISQHWNNSTSTTATTNTTVIVEDTSTTAASSAACSGALLNDDDDDDDDTDVHAAGWCVCVVRVLIHVFIIYLAYDTS